MRPVALQTGDAANEAIMHGLRLWNVLPGVKDRLRFGKDASPVSPIRGRAERNVSRQISSASAAFAAASSASTVRRSNSASSVSRSRASSQALATRSISASIRCASVGIVRPGEGARPRSATSASKAGRAPASSSSMRRRASRRSSSLGRQRRGPRRAAASRPWRTAQSARSPPPPSACASRPAGRPAVVPARRFPRLASSSRQSRGRAAGWRRRGRRRAARRAPRRPRGGPPPPWCARTPPQRREERRPMARPALRTGRPTMFPNAIPLGTPFGDQLRRRHGTACGEVVEHGLQARPFLAAASRASPASRRAASSTARRRRSWRWPPGPACRRWPTGGDPKRRAPISARPGPVPRRPRPARRASSAACSARRRMPARAARRSRSERGSRSAPRWPRSCRLRANASVWASRSAIWVSSAAAGRGPGPPVRPAGRGWRRPAGAGDELGGRDAQPCGEARQLARGGLQLAVHAGEVPSALAVFAEVRPEPFDIVGAVEQRLVDRRRLQARQRGARGASRRHLAWFARPRGRQAPRQASRRSPERRPA